MKYRRFFVILALPVLLLSFSLLPAYAAVDYNDYISNLKVDGDNDLVTVTFPGSFSNWSVSQNGSEIYNGTSESFTGVPVDGLSGLQVFSNVFYGSGRLDVTNIPDGTSVSGSYDVRINWSSPTTSAFSYRTTFVVHYLSSSGYVGSVVIDDSTESNNYPGTIGYSFAIPYSFVMDKPDSALTAYFEFQIAFLSNTNAASSLSASMSPMTMQMSISSLYRLQQQTGKTNQLLEQVEDQLAANGEKLDDIISGGSAGDDLMSGSDKLEDAGAGLGDSIGDISDFEDTYMGQLDDQLPDILASADLNYLVSPLAFVKMYTDKIVAGVPSQYLLIFTLPALFGIFFYIVGHPIRAPKPDTSGDVVTRETFTTTTVLTGKHAGQTSTVRTVTQSQEIGRVSGASDN